MSSGKPENSTFDFEKEGVELYSGTILYRSFQKSTKERHIHMIHRYEILHGPAADSSVRPMFPAWPLPEHTYPFRGKGTATGSSAACASCAHGRTGPVCLTVPMRTYPSGCPIWTWPGYQAVIASIDRGKYLPEGSHERDRHPHPTPEPWR